MTHIRIVPAQEFVEGGGFRVHRPFPVQGLPQFDPFLLIDEMGPVDYAPGEAIGAPDHPHRGFETITYIIDGWMQHEDSHGHRGDLRNGDVQWMTAGSGVIHSEMPAEELRRNGGRMHGFQIWVNLPREQKMTQPRYQEYSSHQLPIVESGGAWVRIIAGEYGGKRSPIGTTVPTTMFHVRLARDTAATFAIPRASNAIVYAIGGGASTGGKKIASHDVALVERAPDSIVLHAGPEGFEGLVLSGTPLNEPVVRYGPFVMNTMKEVEQAFEDFREGRFGEIARKG